MQHDTTAQTLSSASPAAKCSGRSPSSLAMPVAAAYDFSRAVTTASPAFLPAAKCKGNSPACPAVLAASGCARRSSLTTPTPALAFAAKCSGSSPCELRVAAPGNASSSSSMTCAMQVQRHLQRAAAPLSAANPVCTVSRTHLLFCRFVRRCAVKRQPPCTVCTACGLRVRSEQGLHHCQRGFAPCCQVQGRSSAFIARKSSFRVRLQERQYHV